MICKHSVDSKKYLLVDSKKCLLVYFSERAAVKPNTTGCVCFYSGEGGGGGVGLFGVLWPVRSELVTLCITSQGQGGGGGYQYCCLSTSVVGRSGVGGGHIRT